MSPSSLEIALETVVVIPGRSGLNLVVLCSCGGARQYFDSELKGAATIRQLLDLVHHAPDCATIKPM